MMIQSLPLDVIAFLKEIESLGFSLCLVGGATRDFYYFKKLGKDLDFEIRPASALGPEMTWNQYYKKLHTYFSENKIVYTELPYLITRIEYAGYSFEFSSPRLEENVPDNFSHHHFKAELDPTLDYQSSFKRRDFTINAIGLELGMHKGVEVVVDPYGGSEDLHQGILKNINDDFFNDSVRFLRLIRFAIKFDRFVIDPLLLSHLDKFNLSQLSVHHFKEELFKSRPGLFLNKFKMLVLESNLKVPEKFHVWLNYDYPEDLVQKEELLAFIFLQNPIDAKNVAHFFSLPDKTFKDLESFFNSYQHIKSVSKDIFEKLLSLPLDVALKDPLIRDLKNLEEKKQWRSFLKLKGKKELAVDWDDWSGVKVTSEELETITTPLRSFFIFYKTLKAKFLHD